MSDKERDKLRQAFAYYKETEGCACCQDIQGHRIAEAKLAKILKPEPYEDGSGWRWEKYISEQ